MASNYTESEEFYFKKGDLLANCVPVLQEIRNNKKLCDIEIKVKDKTISAHRIILSATIPYFYKMFCADNQEIGKEIVLDEYNPNLIEALINYSYSGEIKMRVEYIENLMVCADLFELRDIKDECIKFMASNLNSSNVFIYKRIAESNNLESFITTTEKYICKNFDEVSSSQEFLQLDSRDLVEIIEKSDLKVSSEERVYEAAMNWIKHNQEKRLSALPEVLKNVRLTLVRPEYLVNVVSKENYIKASTECRDILDEAKNSQLLLLQNDWSLKISNIEPRQYMTEAIYLVCGSDLKESTLRNSILVFKENRWTEVTKLPKEKMWFGGALLNDKIYVVGGLIGNELLSITSSIEIFNLKRNDWTQSINSTDKRKFFGVAALHDSIYVCGGRKNNRIVNSVECFAESRKEWKEVASLNQKRGWFATVSLNGYIYTIGGWGDVTATNSCERFCPTANKWSFVKAMKTARYGLGAATLDGKIYVCGGQDSEDEYLNSCEVYDPQTNKWAFIASMREKRTNCPVTACNGKLYAIGGTNNEGKMSSVEEYCPEKNQWKLVTPLPAKVYDAFAVTVNL